MKKIILYCLLIFGMSAEGLAQDYPEIVLGDDGYHIEAAFGFIRLDFDGDGDFARIPECAEDWVGWLRFRYPNPSPGSTQAMRVQVRLLEQNYITGENSLVGIYGWDPIEPIGTPAPSITFTMAPDFYQFKPQHRYYANIKIQKRILGIWWNIANGWTETMNVGNCENDCGDFLSLVLGDLNSSPAAQEAGIYNPKYEAGLDITSTTPLASGEELILDAGTAVYLKPGFHADYGSKFSAWIDGCGGRSNDSEYEDVEVRRSETRYPPLISTELEEEELVLINIYPNPTSGVLNIEFEEVLLNAHFEVYNANGAIVASKKKIDNNRIQFDLSEKPTGVYFLRVIQDDQIITRKIIKQ